ncbi:hypothetical protein FACS1894218_3570 [Bacilli bacterium]|nr:hypothetical protein FACS1894218_3570 [Bacilli bacterium]
MAKNYFPINYKPLYSIVETRSYIAGYLKKLFIKLEHNRNAIYVDPPLAINYHHN